MARHTRLTADELGELSSDDGWNQYPFSLLFWSGNVGGRMGGLQWTNTTAWILRRVHLERGDQRFNKNNRLMLSRLACPIKRQWSVLSYTNPWTSQSVQIICTAKLTIAPLAPSELCTSRMRYSQYTIQWHTLNNFEKETGAKQHSTWATFAYVCMNMSSTLNYNVSNLETLSKIENK